MVIEGHLKHSLTPIPSHQTGHFVGKSSCSVRIVLPHPERQRRPPHRGIPFYTLQLQPPPQSRALILDLPSFDIVNLGIRDVKASVGAADLIPHTTRQFSFIIL
ncbi:hypothetical protein J6590_033757 [Homalodisca vitripennis]|nr:hypothetical protein J6590_033757 [Homalodisca vitripennis]